MTAPDLDAIRARLAAAESPSPWRVFDVEHDGARVCDARGVALVADHGYAEAPGVFDAADAELIAHAPTDLAALLARVAELEQELATEHGKRVAAAVIDWFADRLGQTVQPRVFVQAREHFGAAATPCAFCDRMAVGIAEHGGTAMRVPSCGPHHGIPGTFVGGAE